MFNQARGWVFMKARAPIERPTRKAIASARARRMRWLRTDRAELNIKRPEMGRSTKKVRAGGLAPRRAATLHDWRDGAAQSAGKLQGGRGVAETGQDRSCARIRLQPRPFRTLVPGNPGLGARVQAGLLDGSGRAADHRQPGRVLASGLVRAAVAAVSFGRRVRGRQGRLPGVARAPRQRAAARARAAGPPDQLVDVFLGPGWQSVRNHLVRLRVAGAQSQARRPLTTALARLKQPATRPVPAPAWPRSARAAPGCAPPSSAVNRTKGRRPEMPDPATGARSRPSNESA